MTVDLDSIGEPHPVAAQRTFRAAQRRRWAPLTIALAVVLVGIYALEVLWGGGLTPSRAVEYAMGANHGRSVAHGQIERLFASAFLHGSLLHLGVNVMSLLALAPLFEKLLGASRLSVLYLCCALLGATASAAVHPATLSLGASGAIWGLMGGLVGLVLRPRGLLPPLLAADMRRGLVFPLLLNLGISLQPGIDLAAHLGGGVAGLVLVGSGVMGAGLAPLGAPRRPGLQRLFRALSIALWILASASLLTALARGRPWDRSPFVAAATTTAERA